MGEKDEEKKEELKMELKQEQGSVLKRQTKEEIPRFTTTKLEQNMKPVDCRKRVTIEEPGEALRGQAKNLETKAGRPGRPVAKLERNAKITDTRRCIKVETPVETLREQANNFEELLAGIAPQVSRFDRTSAVIECKVPLGFSCLEALATPVRGSSADGQAQLRVPCTIQFHEDANGSVVPQVEARLTGLDPALAYSITVCV